MGKIIKMDFYRLLQSKMFWIMSGVMFFVMALVQFSTPFLFDLLKSFSPNPDSISETYDKSFISLISSPTESMTGWLIILLFISAASFLYADIKNGYIKNFAGQLPRRSYTVTSKFIVLLFHNFVFLTAGALGKIFGMLICPKANILFDDFSYFGFILFFVKFILSVAMVSLILLLATGLRNKTLAIVLGVLLSVNALSLLYLGINQLLSLIGVKNFDLNDYTLDGLYSKSYDISSLSSSNGQLILNSLCVSVAFTVLSFVLTVLLVNKRDVK